MTVNWIKQILLPITITVSRADYNHSHTRNRFRLMFTMQALGTSRPFVRGCHFRQFTCVSVLSKTDTRSDWIGSGSITGEGDVRQLAGGTLCVPLLPSLQRSISLTTVWYSS
uniref:Putative secreted peptide n=1 Tax=Anopheles braziliensis TaxID=58242 RepID=A0A2M3ZT35_9DIPT